MARFPTGPLRIAQALGVPVVTFFGVYRGPKRYDLHFEPLAAESGADGNVAALVERYVARLERHVREAPMNWFNFYLFWSDA
jgi:predicted LPLAT superfamily acyltransferase